MNTVLLVDGVDTGVEVSIEKAEVGSPTMVVASDVSIEEVVVGSATMVEDREVWVSME